MWYWFWKLTSQVHFSIVIAWYILELCLDIWEKAPYTLVFPMGSIKRKCFYWRKFQTQGTFAIPFSFLWISIHHCDCSVALWICPKCRNCESFYYLKPLGKLYQLEISMLNFRAISVNHFLFCAKSMQKILSFKNNSNNIKLI